MPARRSLAVLWGVVGSLLLLIAVLMWAPMRVAWQCYWLHENAPREQARVMAKLEHGASFGLLIEEGPHAGQGCTADTSAAIFESTAQGDRVEVVYVTWKPGECELSSTVEASAAYLWGVVAVLALLVAAILAFAMLMTRSFTRPAEPARRMEVAARDVRCPACDKPMDEGYVPLLAGMHWRRIGDPIGMPHALGGLPGTVGMRGRPRLHAFRCVPCEILTLQYGDPAPRRAGSRG